MSEDKISELNDLRRNDIICTVKDFVQAYNEQRLLELVLNQVYTLEKGGQIVQHPGSSLLELNLPELWEEILQNSIKWHEVKPETIESIVLFGEAVNEKPYKTELGEKRQFLKWKWYEEDSLLLHEPIEVGVFVLCQQDFQGIKPAILREDNLFGGKSPKDGFLNLIYLTKDKFAKAIKHDLNYAMQVFREGVILADNGGFRQIIEENKELAEKTRHPLYSVKWSSEDKESVMSEPIKDFFLKARLAYTGNNSKF